MNENPWDTVFCRFGIARVVSANPLGSNSYMIRRSDARSSGSATRNSKTSCEGKSLDRGERI